MRKKYWIASVLASTLAAGFVAGAAERAIVGGGGDGFAQVTQRTFSGSSGSADFDEALDDALSAADLYFGSIGADIRYSWELDAVDGQRGGFLFVNDLFVTITAKARF